MSTVIFTSFEDFRRRAGDLWVDDVEEVLSELLRLVVTRLAEWALEITAPLPRVRGSLPKGAWEVHTSWFAHVNEGSRVEADFNSASTVALLMRQAEAGDRAGIANMAFQSGFVNFGRARGSNGKLIGSPAAPSGITKPVLERLAAEMESLQVEAINRAVPRMRAA